MRKIIATLAIAALSTSPVFAQSSAAARAQQLEKLEEDLNSPDPNLRLAAFEVAMESSSLSIKRRAIEISLSSADSTLKSIASRYFFCENSNLILRHSYDERAKVQWGFLKSGQRAIQIRNCDPVRGSFQTFVPPEYGGQDTTRSGSFSGSSVNFEFWFTSSFGRGDCSVSLTLNQEKNFGGRMSCQNGGRTFGPVSALIVMG